VWLLSGRPHIQEPQQYEFYALYVLMPLRPISRGHQSCRQNRLTPCLSYWADYSSGGPVISKRPSPLPSLPSFELCYKHECIPLILPSWTYITGSSQPLTEINTRNRKLMFLGSKVTILLPSVSRLSRQCGILNISQPYRPPGPDTGIALLYGDGVCFLWGTNWTVNTATSNQYLAVNCEPIV
jgi:hypothetical protein